MEDLEHLKYPVGRFQKPSELCKEHRAGWIKIIEELPEKLKKEVSGLSDAQLDTPYRPEGWTVRQTIHHFADSHINAFIRFKLALTEDKPIIKPYFEDKFAKLPDTAKAPIESSLNILDGIHKRFTILLNSMTDEDFERKYIHPELGREISLKENLALYAWHSKHHLAHITKLKKRMGW
jgi:hypothetical protein